MTGLAWTTPRTWSVGDIDTATIENARRDQATFLSSPPIGRFTQSAAQSIPNNALTALALDTNVFDTYSGHSTVTNNSRYTVQQAGYYRVDGSFSIAASGAGIRLVEVFLTGAQLLDSQVTAVPSAGFSLSLATKSVLVQAVVGDYFEVYGYQTSGGALNTQAGGYCAMTIELVHV